MADQKKVRIDSEEPLFLAVTPKELILISNCLNAIIKMGAAMNKDDLSAETAKRIAHMIQLIQAQAANFGQRRFYDLVTRIIALSNTIDIEHKEL